MEPNKTPHEWSKDTLLDKAQRYTELMILQDKNDWQFGFWSVMILEMLARAALSNISITLIADNKDWNNLYYSLGKTVSGKKFTPKSANISDIFTRLEILLPGFNSEILNFCLIHIERRNEEFHTGSLPFDELGTSKWLGKFYLTCKVLLESMQLNLTKLFGKEEAINAEKLIAAMKDETAKSVMKNITAHKTIWDDLTLVDQEKLKAQAGVFATRKNGHRTKCPSCNCDALLYGDPFGGITKKLEEDLIIIKQSMLPSHFECVACGLKINGFSKLNSCGLGDNFTETTYYEPNEYYRSEDEDPYYEEDFNEF
ncbi:MAG: hypothetical protein SFU98_08875 [Leptospiraceae bacterium]|nr:hypothetical protein [Leptospiraceae bacterium]